MGPVCMVRVCTGRVGMGPVCMVRVCTGRVGMGPVCMVRVCTGRVGMGPVCMVRVCTGRVGMGPVCMVRVCTGRVGMGPVCMVRVCTGRVGMGPVCMVRVCTGRVGMGPVCMVRVCTGRVGMGPVCMVRVCTGRVGMGPVCMVRVCTGRVGMGPVCMVRVCTGRVGMGPVCMVRVCTGRVGMGPVCMVRVCTQVEYMCSTPYTGLQHQRGADATARGRGHERKAWKNTAGTAPGKCAIKHGVSARAAAARTALVAGSELTSMNTIGAWMRRVDVIEPCEACRSVRSTWRPTSVQWCTGREGTGHTGLSKGAARRCFSNDEEHTCSVYSTLWTLPGSECGRCLGRSVDAAWHPPTQARCLSHRASTTPKHVQPLFRFRPPVAGGSGRQARIKHITAYSANSAGNSVACIKNEKIHANGVVYSKQNASRAGYVTWQIHHVRCMGQVSRSVSHSRFRVSDTHHSSFSSTAWATRCTHDVNRILIRIVCIEWQRSMRGAHWVSQEIG